MSHCGDPGNQCVFFLGRGQLPLFPKSSCCGKALKTKCSPDITPTTFPTPLGLLCLNAGPAVIKFFFEKLL